MAIEDEVVVAVGVLEVDDSVAIGVHGRAAPPELDDVGGLVAVVVQVVAVEATVAVGVRQQLVAVEDPVVVRVVVAEVGDAIRVRVSWRRRDALVSSLDAVGHAVAIAVVVQVVRLPIPIGVDRVAPPFVLVRDAVPVRVPSDGGVVGAPIPFHRGWRRVTSEEEGETQEGE